MARTASRLKIFFRNGGHISSSCRTMVVTCSTYHCMHIISLISGKHQLCAPFAGATVVKLVCSLQAIKEG
eukprot:scaffold161490_cov33-Prasinocladus_malaysianus.AAC.14